MYFVIHLKLKQHCKSTILQQINIKNKKIVIDAEQTGQTT